LDDVTVHEDEAVMELQKEEVLKRLGLIEKGEMKTRSWDDVKSELFNMKGEVIGITTMGLQDGSIFFALSIKEIPYWRYVR
jgi:hypothetical protein